MPIQWWKVEVVIEIDPATTQYQDGTYWNKEKVKDLVCECMIHQNNPESTVNILVVDVSNGPEC